MSLDRTNRNQQGLYNHPNGGIPPLFIIISWKIPQHQDKNEFKKKQTGRDGTPH